MVRKAPRLLALVVTSVWFLAKGAGAQPIGGIDSPADGQTVSGIVRVSGFVLDFSAVDRIELLVDGVLVNRADINLPRPDVLEIFPTYVGSATPNPGFLTSFLARGVYTDGPHSIAIRVTESATQDQFVIGTINVVVNSSLNQAPFGYIDIPGAAGLEGANGSFPVAGWALDDVNVDHIDFFVDGRIVAGAVGRGGASNAIYGTTRPDVAAAFPDVPNSLLSGFLANIDTTALVNGLHEISVRATDGEGASRDLGHRTVQVINNGANLPPFGRIDFPLDKASLFCTGTPGGFPSPCTPDICSPSLFNVVAGWALDVGSALDRGQVAYLELLLDGQIISNTRRDCVQVNGALTNCYGINRPDVARLYSGYVNADNAGFNFSFFLGRDDTTGRIEILSPRATTGNPELVGFTTAGKHTLAIRAGDEEETVTQFGAMSVDILCGVSGGDQPAIGFIDTPTDYQFINGIFEVFGWATDFQGVAQVEVDVDGYVVGTARYGLNRPDVPANDFRVLSSLVGFSFLLDTTTLSDSPHDLVIYVVDRDAHRTEIGRRKFVVNNNVATHQ
ncbi:MAG: Ig-like domain-containing protein [Thermoanaerobaculia bacterium]